MTSLIVIPMAGESRRFREAGYAVPKYRLEAGGKSLFAHAVGSFSAYFGTTPFLFVVRDAEDARAFVEAECRKLGIAEARIVSLSSPTRGQAETVAIGMERAGIADDAEFAIFNIDTIRPGFRFPTSADLVASDGSLEVFRGEGGHWSFVRPSAQGGGRVAETTEKVRISDLCCTGLYRFRKACYFREAFAKASGTLREGQELYVAPLYNQLIAAGMDVRYWVIDSRDVIFSGIPDEFEAFKRSYESKDGSRLAR